VTEARFEEHLLEAQVVAIVDGTLTDDMRDAIHGHLARCADCRAEVLEVSAVVRTLPHARRLPGRAWIPAAAAAVLVAFLVTPQVLRHQVDPQHREQELSTTLAPRAMAPVGIVSAVDTLAWSPVPGADRYRVRLFDSEGTLVWEGETTNALAVVPSSIRLADRRPYFWKVEARTGFDRWAASTLVEFSIGRAGAP
jgi:anti-sigma factor RsiW